MSLYRAHRQRNVDPDFTRPAHSGIYYVGSHDLDRLAATATREALRVCRIDLSGCHGKDDLLRRLGVSLERPAGFGDDWDALADSLRDLRWMPAWGYVLLFDHADDLRNTAPADFDTLLGMLDDAATYASDQDMPWFACIALPEAMPDNAP